MKNKSLKFFATSIFVAAFLLAPPVISAQRKDRVEVFPRIFTESAAKNCESFRAGQTVFYLEPDFPNEAKTGRIGGTVEVMVKVDEKGKVAEVEKVAGNRLLQGAASNAAIKVKFTPTVCAGIPIAVSAFITYNFIPFIAVESYFVPAKVEDFSDVKADSQSYEAIFNLTENYKIAFGYEDKKFYPDAPLTRGDFAHFLRLTLDLLSEQAKNANKMPGAIGLFNSNNPNKLTSVDKVKDLDKKSPFYDSTRALILKYDISLAGEKNEFGGRLPLMQNQLLDLWKNIFGSEALPVNFGRVNGADKIITRGDFALFLQESLGVLTYKVLP